MKHLSAEPRCTNTILKPDVDILHWPKSQKALDRLPRERCARPLLPIYDPIDRFTVIATYCNNCDGPLHRHERGPDAVNKYYAARRNHPGLT